MCVTCGCSDDSNVRITNSPTAANEHHHPQSHSHTLANGTVVTHSHAHTYPHQPVGATSKLKYKRRKNLRKAVSPNMRDCYQ